MVGSPTIACSSGDTPQTLFKPPGPPLRLAGVGLLKHRPQVQRLGKTHAMQACLFVLFRYFNTHNRYFLLYKRSDVLVHNHLLLHDTIFFISNFVSKRAFSYQSLFILNQIT